MDFKDKTIECRDCKKNFVFVADEQKFFHEHDLANEPSRCLDCRVINRLKRSGDGGKLTEVTCDECGDLTKVPFVPTGKRPVLCSPCFRTMQKAKIEHP